MVSTATATERFIAAILRDSLDIESVRAAVSAGALVTAEDEERRSYLHEETLRGSKRNALKKRGVLCRLSPHSASDGSAYPPHHSRHIGSPLSPSHHTLTVQKQTNKKITATKENSYPPFSVRGLLFYQPASLDLVERHQQQQVVHSHPRIIPVPSVSLCLSTPMEANSTDALLSHVAYCYDNDVCVDPETVSRCASDGADLTAEFHTEECNDTILCMLLRLGSVECVSALLRNFRGPIDFMAAGPRVSRTPLDILLEVHGVDDVLPLLLERSAMDTDDEWGRSGGLCKCLLTAAARYGVLARTYFSLQTTTLLENAETPIELDAQGSWSDWDELPDAGRQRLCLLGGLTSCPESTAELAELCGQEGLLVSAVHHCIQRYADLEAVCPLSGLRFCERLILYGSVDVAAACFTTPNTSFLHSCLAALSLSFVATTPAKILSRICEDDRFMARCGQTPRKMVEAFLQHAARHGTLSFFWPHLRRQLIASTWEGARFCIECAWAWDWNRIEQRDALQFLQRDERFSMYLDNEATSALHRLPCMYGRQGKRLWSPSKSKSVGSPDAMALEAYVARHVLGAPNMAFAPSDDLPCVLEEFLRCAPVGCVRALLTTTAPMRLRPAVSRRILLGLSDREDLSPLDKRSTDGERHGHEEALVKLCREPHPDQDVVRSCVERYASLSDPCPLGSASLKERLVVFGSVELAVACCSTPNPVEFEESLMALCLRTCDTQGALEVLNRVLGEGGGATRYGRRPPQVARQFLLHAAGHGLLSTFWPALSRHAALQDVRPSNPVLLGDVWEFDLARLETREVFQVEPGGRRETDTESTSVLFRLSLCSCCLGGAAWEAAVKEHVLRGGNLHYAAHGGESTLHHFIQRGSIASVAACLQSPLTIDFTRTGWCHNTVFHLVCFRENCDGAAVRDAGPQGACETPGDAAHREAVEILRLLVDRLAAHPEDTVDFSLPDYLGSDFISYAPSPNPPPLSSTIPLPSLLNNRNKKKKDADDFPFLVEPYLRFFFPLILYRLSSTMPFRFHRAAPLPQLLLLLFFAMSAAVVAPGSIAASPASLDHLVELLSTVVQQQQEGMKAMQTALEGISRQLQETNAHLTRFLDQQGLEAVKSRATEELAWAACKNVSPQVVRAHLDRGGDQVAEDEERQSKRNALETEESFVGSAHTVQATGLRILLTRMEHNTANNV
eukprot:gene7703-5405_t